MTAGDAADSRWDAVAEVLVRHSTRVRPGDRVMLAMGEVDTYPLVRAVHAAVIRAGGLPQVQFLSEELRHAILRDGDADQLAWVPELEAHGMAWADVYIALRGGFDLTVHDDIAPERLAVNQAAQGVVSSLRWAQTRWCLVRVPNQAFAAQAGLGLEGLLDMFFDACLLDWEASGALWNRWCAELDGSSSVRILGTGTDLSFSVEGRSWLAFSGANNMPDGEIMTAPVTETIDGTIWFENPGVLGGRLMHDLRFTWERGTLVEATASTNQAYLDEVLNADGARTIGEFGIGTNPAVDRFCNDILLDEKILGTCHIAMGRAYPEVGGTNQSSIHWDVVKDIRDVGEVLVDGRQIVHRGKVLL